MRAAGWRAGCLEGWLSGWKASRLAGWLGVWLTDWLDGWLAGWLAVWLGVLILFKWVELASEMQRPEGGAKFAVWTLVRAPGQLGRGWGLDGCARWRKVTVTVTIQLNWL